MTLLDDSSADDSFVSVRLTTDDRFGAAVTVEQTPLVQFNDLESGAAQALTAHTSENGAHGPRPQVRSGRRGLVASGCRRPSQAHRLRTRRVRSIHD